MDFAQLIPSVDPLGWFLLATFVFGFTEVVKRAYDRDFRSVIIILGAALVGGLVALGLDGVPFMSGAAIAIQFTGLVTAGQLVTKKIGVQG